MGIDPKLKIAFKTGWNFLWRWTKSCDILSGTLVVSFVSAIFASEHEDRPLLMWLKDYSHIIDLITIWLASSGILYAVRHEYKLEMQTLKIAEQLSQLTRQNEELKRLEGSLSTRRIGVFPLYISELTELVKGAKVSLDILADCLDYGSFFAPAFHQELHEALLAKGNKITIRILVCGKPPQPYTNPSGHDFRNYIEDFENGDLNEYLGSYYSALKNDHGFQRWLEALNCPQNAKYEAFINYWFEEGWLESDGMKIQVNEILSKCVDVCFGKTVLGKDQESPIVFLMLLQARQLWFAQQLWFRNVKIQGIDSSQPMYLWIRDKVKDQVNKEDEGLFTFAKAAHGPGQLGYRTHDSDLLNAFRAEFDELWKESEASNPNWLKVVKMA